jgi:hypothetical protein
MYAVPISAGGKSEPGVCTQACRFYGLSLSCISSPTLVVLDGTQNKGGASMIASGCCHRWLGLLLRAEARACSIATTPDCRDDPRHAE